MDIVTLALAKAYVNKSLDGIGAVQGRNCQVSKTSIDGGHTVTFSWYDDTETPQVLKTTSIDVMDGEEGNSLVSVEKDREEDNISYYTMTMSDGTEFEFEVTNGVNADVEVYQNDHIYKLKLVSADGTQIITPDLKGNTFHSGVDVASNNESGDNVVVLSGTKVGDIYYNTGNNNFYQRKDHHNLANNWMYLGNLKGSAGIGFYDDTRRMPEYAGKTDQEIFAMVTGQTMPVRKVVGKPDITKDSTLVNCLYYYQQNGDIPEALSAINLPVFIGNKNMSNLIDYLSGNYQVAITDNNDVTTYYGFTTQNTIPAFTNRNTYGYRVEVLIDESVTPNVPMVRIVRTPVSGLFYDVAIETITSVTTSATEIGGYTLIPDTMVNFLDVARSCYICYTEPLDFTDYPDGIPVGTYSSFRGTRWLNWEFTATIPKPADGYEYRLYMDDILMQGMVFYCKSDGSMIKLARLSSTPITESSEPRGTDLELVCHEIGEWYQTIYAGSSRDNCADITLRAGQSLDGIIMKDEFDRIIGRDNLRTTSQTVKGAINEHDLILRTGTTDELNTTSKNVIGAINELHTNKIGYGDIVTTISEASDNQHVPSAKAVYNAILDALYPIGAIALGTKPSFGDWEELTGANGRALWVDSTKTAGTTIEAGLPNITGALTGNGRNLLWGGGQATGVFGYTSASGKWLEASGNSGGGNPNFDASRSSAIYGKSNTVQPPAYVVKAWIRVS